MKHPVIPKKRPGNSHPGENGAEFLVDMLFDELSRIALTYAQLSAKARVSEDTLKQWRARESIPQLDKIAACFELLGFELRPVHTGINPSPEDPYNPMDLDQWHIEKQRMKRSDP